ncbi:MAG TPA: HlyD family efflux transporter periplasmic adaptor subunit, partial [Gemmata sp.]
DETNDVRPGAPDQGAVELYGPRPSGRTRRRLVVGLLVLLGLGGAAAGAGVLSGFLPKPVVAGDPNASGRGDPAEAGAQQVKVVRPLRDPNFRITTTQFAVVEPFYQAGLRARVTGVVRGVSKDIGEPVRVGELLVDIDAPELKLAVEQKDAVVLQRERELAVAQADLAVARSMAAAATVAVRSKLVDVERMKDTRAARKIDLEAITVLFKQDAVQKNKVDAAELDFRSAERGVEVAETDVEKAKVDEAGKVASLEKAQADVELKRALIEVARRDRDAAVTQYGYARLYAPFDGTVVARSTDPGRFVTPTGADPLVTVARTDLVTVVAKIPDSAAPFVSWSTEALVEFSQLPGVTVRGFITRYSRAIDPADQTMRVEVDVYNGPEADYRAMLGRAAAESSIAALIPFDRGLGIAAAGAGLIRGKADHKGWHEGYALIPNWGPDGGYQRIVAGTTGNMRLDLEKFGESFLLPSGAVYSRAGQSYILVVENGVTKAVAVSVQMNDGTLTKVAAVLPVAGGRRVTRELTGKEVIVAARQLEIGEGRKVTPVFDKP